MTRSTVALAMMVHNEAHLLPRIWENLKDRLDAAVIIIRPEYEDDSEAVARKLFGHLPGQILAMDHPKPNGAANSRNQVIDLARDFADYVLWLDPDSPLEGTIPDKLTEPLYRVRVEEAGSGWDLIKLLKSDTPVRFDGRVHEYIDPQEFAHPRLEGVSIPVAESKDRRERMLTLDIPWLLEEIEVDPGNPRWVFYLAQTYKDVGDADNAIKYYEQRASMQGFVEETFYAMYELGRLWMGRNDEHAERWLLRAHAYRPGRFEPLVQLAWLYLCHGEYHFAAMVSDHVHTMTESTDTLFVNHWRGDL